MLRCPEDNKQLLAALFGTMEREVREGCVLEATPWVQQLVRDVEQYVAVTGAWGVATNGLLREMWALHLAAPVRVAT